MSEKNQTPKKYSDSKEMLMKALWNANPDIYEEIRDEVLPKKKQMKADEGKPKEFTDMIKYILNNDGGKELLNRYIESNNDEKRKFVREFYLRFPDLIENLYLELPKPPKKCKICGNFPEKTEGGYVCNGVRKSGENCVLKGIVTFSSIEEWNDKAGA